MNDIQNCEIDNRYDTKSSDLESYGNPTGGSVLGVGLSIHWQDGPLGMGADRKAANGAFVETVISAAKQRLEYFQESKFACRENELAIKKLQEALGFLEQRTANREGRGVEGTHNV